MRNTTVAVRICFILMQIVVLSRGAKKTARDPWHSLLWELSDFQSGGENNLHHDPLAERLCSQIFLDSIRPKLQSRQPLFSSEVDPLWLWPIEQSLKQAPLTADFYACDVYLHNLRSLTLNQAS